MTKIFEEYYSQLYNHKPNTHDKLGNEFLTGPNIPLLNQDMLLFLNSPVTQEEIYTTIKQISSNKAPGTDCVSTEFIKMMQENIFISTLLDVYSWIWQGGPFLPSGREAYTKLLPKPRKDATSPSAYRSIL